MSNKLTLTCSSARAVGDSSLPSSSRHAESCCSVLLSCTDRCLHFVGVGGVAASKLLLLSNVQCRHGGRLLLRCGLFLRSSPGIPLLDLSVFRRLRLLYPRPPCPRDSCVKQSQLTSPDWVSFIRFLQHHLFLIECMLKRFSK